MSLPKHSRRDFLGLAAAGVGGLVAPACGMPVPATATPLPASRDATPLPVLPRPAGFHAGMNLAHLHRGDLGYGSDACRQQLARLAALGVTHVALTPFGYLEDIGSCDFIYGASLDRSLTDAHLARAASDAVSLGLKVTIKPHIWSREFWAGGKSRQDMAPTYGDWDAWFAAYTGFAEHYARLAQQIGAVLYVVGLEYLQATLNARGAWADVAAACRRHYGGALTYAANWWEEADRFADWRAFDFIGVNAYHPLSKAEDPDTAGLVAGWRHHRDALGALSARHDRPLLFTEAGLQAVHGAAAEPWNHTEGGAEDDALQARAYEALLSAFTGQPWFSGVYWWKWFTAAQGEGHDRYSPAGRPAELVLRRWWTG